MQKRLLEIEGLPVPRIVTCLRMGLLLWSVYLGFQNDTAIVMPNPLLVPVASLRPSSGENQMSWITHKQDRMFGKVVAKYRPLAGHVGLSWSHLESALECDLSHYVSCVGKLQLGYEVLVTCLYTGKPLYLSWSLCPSWHFATTFLVVSEDDAFV